MKTLILITLTLVSLTAYSQSFDKRKDNLVNRLMDEIPNRVDSTTVNGETLYGYQWDEYKLVVFYSRTIPFERPWSYEYALKSRSGGTFLIEDRISRETHKRILRYNKELENKQ